MNNAKIMLNMELKFLSSSYIKEGVLQWETQGRDRDRDNKGLQQKNRSQPSGLSHTSIIY